MIVLQTIAHDEMCWGAQKLFYTVKQNANIGNLN